MKMCSNTFLPFLLSLNAPLVPNCHQSSTQSCSQGQLDRGSSVTKAGAAAGHGDAVVYSQDGESCLIFAGRFFCAATFMDWQQVGTKLGNCVVASVLISGAVYRSIAEAGAENGHITGVTGEGINCNKQSQ